MPLGVVGLEVDLGVDNEHASQLFFDNFDYALALNGTNIVDGVVSTFDIDGATVGTLTLPISVSLLDIGFELFDVPLDLAYPPRRINGPLQPAGDVRSGFRLSPDGRRVFYLADQDQDEVFELYGASALHARRAELR